MVATTYLALARKWRPSQFLDLVGQEAVIRTLVNAVIQDRLFHAYLLTGSRGVGKTTIARLFAKLIRCPNRKIISDQMLEACNTCSSCAEINQSKSVDVIEIDGASNNGVDAVREIRENAKFLPSSGAKKIYIIDEVHMLTTAAFNALLKTLEEPPAHVIFIFATTEPQKIPATILSRCQQFDFKRMSLAQLQERLRVISQAEAIQIEPGALVLIARAADGSMRDALSILDQVRAYSPQHITVQATRESVGLVESESLLTLLESILKNQTLSALAEIQAAYSQGLDLKLIVKNLLEFYHALLLAKVGATEPTFSLVTPEEWSRIHSLKDLQEIEHLELQFQILHYGLDAIARSPQPKITTDLLILKCAAAEKLERVTTKHLTPSQPELQPSPIKPAVPSPVAHAQVSSHHWEGFVKLVRAKRPMIASMLERAQPSLGITPSSVSTHGEIIIEFLPTEAYACEQLQMKNNRQVLEEIGGEYYGGTPMVQVRLQESLAQKRSREIKQHQIEMEKTARTDPIVLEAQTLFGGTISQIDIHHAPPK